MDKSFRKLALQKLAERQDRALEVSNRVATNRPGVNLDLQKMSGRLADLVRKSLQGPSDFRAKFLAMKPGPERERFVLQEIMRRNPIKQLVPVTIPGPNGTKITYKVMPDYITIDGLRVPMSGQTAQKVADHFGMALPTRKQVDQILESAKVRIRPTPLSAGGKIDGKYYSGQEVVSGMIGDSRSAAAYSDMIEKELRDKRYAGGIVAGHMKDIIQPASNPDRLGLYGWHGEDDKPLEPSVTTGHDTAVHAEYGAGARLIDEDVVVTAPDGTKFKTKMSDLQQHPVFHQAVADRQGRLRYRSSN